MYHGIDYLIFILPAIVLSLWAQSRIKSAYSRASQIAATSGMSGAETARRILDSYGLNQVGIEHAQGFLGDHYDPRSKVLRLSADVYQGRSLAALGVAAHVEVGRGGVEHECSPGDGSSRGQVGSAGRVFRRSTSP